MTRFHRARHSPHFRHYFDAVHPLFWPVLFWQLDRFFKWFKTEQLTSVMLQVTWWGGIRVVYVGDRKAAPNPFALTRPRWDDPVWASNVPACLGNLAATATSRLFSILSRFGGGGGIAHRAMTEGALPSPLDSS